MLLNISDFIFYVKTTAPSPLKITPLFPSNPPLKTEILSSPTFYLFENLVGDSSPLLRRLGGGVHTMSWINLISALNFPKQWVADYRYVFRTLSNPLDYLSCLAVVLRGIHRKVYIYQTDCSIHSELRIFPCSEVTQGSTISKPKKV